MGEPAPGRPCHGQRRRPLTDLRCTCGGPFRYLDRDGTGDARGQEGPLPGSPDHAAGVRWPAPRPPSGRFRRWAGTPLAVAPMFLHANRRITAIIGVICMALLTCPHVRNTGLDSGYLRVPVQTDCLNEVARPEFPSPRGYVVADQAHDVGLRRLDWADLAPLDLRSGRSTPGRRRQIRSD